MKIVIVMGTYRKNGAGAAYLARMQEAVKGTPGVEFEYLWLGDYEIKQCRGCMVCYEKGEAACPLKDGYLNAMKQLNAADAAIFYSPTYTLSITGTMKTFFDRSSYVLHRPYFKGRRALVLTAVDAYGDRPALKTLKTIVSMMGFDIVEATGIVNARYNSQPKYRARIDGKLKQEMRRLVDRATSGDAVRPTLFELFAFQFQKSVFGSEMGGAKNDKLYWKNAGWTDEKTDFYCKARIPFVKKLLAKAIAAGIKKTGLIPGS